MSPDRNARETSPSTLPFRFVAENTFADALASQSRPPVHSRSHSHNSPISSSHPAHNNPNWTSLIPPLPLQPAPVYNPQRQPLVGQINQKSPNQRHSIAVSPSGLRPDLFGDAQGPSQVPLTKLAHPYARAVGSMPPRAPTSELPPPLLQAPSYSANTTPREGTNTYPVDRKALVDEQMLLKNVSDGKPPLKSSISEGKSVLGERKDHPGTGNPVFNGKATPESRKIAPDTRTLTIRKKKKLCKHCGNEITGQFVRALSSSFHVECFTCHECGQPCLSKFFPYEQVDPVTQVSQQVALCEYDYFKKLQLLCFSCDSALRGPYITALGNKYHLEHFRCTVCSKVFEADESYYEHDSSIYCHYHYLVLHASRCEGCRSAIVKQFVELFRGGRNQQWHPECYMVHKFWNVCVTADAVGLDSRFHRHSLEVQSLRESPVDPEVLVAAERQIEATVMGCWLTLSGYEENSAACISDMLLNACTGNQASGLTATARLIVNVEVLFGALDGVEDLCRANDESYSGPNELVATIEPTDRFQPLRKEPRNICGKIMSYLAILRKCGRILASGSLSADLLSVITGCAHYLKLLIRIGLNNALKLNSVRGSTDASDRFLSATGVYEALSVPGSVSFKAGLADERLAVDPTASDACFACNRSIETACVRQGRRRWHRQCFKCQSCQQQKIGTGEDEPKDKPATSGGVYGKTPSDTAVSCSQCQTGVPSVEAVTDLSQLVYLLKIALARSRTAMENAPDPSPSTNMATITEEKNARSATETDYSQTLSDVTRLRSLRQSQRMSSSVKKKARKSVILRAPEGDLARPDSAEDDDQNDGSRPRSDRVSSVSSFQSYVAHQQDADHFSVSQNAHSVAIRDEPMRQATNNLDRTSDLLKNEKSLTLDDIPRIVAAEQARDQRPNAFKHHQTLYLRNRPEPVKTVAAAGGSQGLAASNATPGTKKTTYYSELSQAQQVVLGHIAIEALLDIQKDIASKDDLIGTFQTKKLGTFWDKFRFGDPKKAPGVFGVDLQDLTSKYGVDLDLGVGPLLLRIPVVIDDVINALRQKDMSVEGIFRLNGNIKRLRDLSDEINKSPVKSPDFAAQLAVQLAALMKKWLRELPNPLLTFGLYDVWIASQRQVEPRLRKRMLQLAYCMLPRSHRNLVEVLLYFFNWVASFAEIDEETGSKMDVHNLATVISPNILYPRTSGDQQAPLGDAYFLAIEVVNQLIEIHEDLSTVPPDLIAFYEKCGFSAKTEVPSSKEITQKVEKALKEDPGFFSRFEAASDDSVVHENTIRRGHSKVLNESSGETANV